MGYIKDDEPPKKTCQKKDKSCNKGEGTPWWINVLIPFSMICVFCCLVSFLIQEKEEVVVEVVAAVMVEVEVMVVETVVQVEMADAAAMEAAVEEMVETDIIY